VANSVHRQVAALTVAVGTSGRAMQGGPGSQLPAPLYHHALATGISRGFLAASGIALAALVVAAVTIRFRREDVADVADQEQPVGPPPVIDLANA
jgi:hypothetical protein